jgi:CheY-like chemotaxis protein
MTRILIADDNKDFIELFESILSSAGYDVSVAYDGSEAMECLKNDPDYDLLITDVIMPGKDGFDLIDFAKSYLDLKIIVVTGGGVFMSSKSAVESIFGQVDMCLEKPIQIDQLLAGIEAVLKP